MKRLAPLALLPLVLASCGGGGGTAAPPATTVDAGPASLLGSGARALYAGGDWAVVEKGARVRVAHRVAGRWVLQGSTNVVLEILGPRPGQRVGSVSQVAFEAKAKQPLVETGIWVDGNELATKGGGTPTEGSIYGGTPKLAPGTHRAVAYARSDEAAAATTWTFVVR
jgi:hypothetical protein